MHIDNRRGKNQIRFNNFIITIYNKDPFNIDNKLPASLNK